MYGTEASGHRILREFCGFVDPVDLVGLVDLVSLVDSLNLVNLVAAQRLLICANVLT